MKLYLIMSDTHGSIVKAREVIEGYPQADGIIHLGDYYKDGLLLQAQFPNIEMIQVSGNCDFIAGIPNERVLEIEGIRILITHGHRYGVKNSLNQLETKAKNENINAVLFGHTHIPLLKNSTSGLILNPGSLGVPRGFSGLTYALFEVSKGRVEARIMDA